VSGSKIFSYRGASEGFTGKKYKKFGFFSGKNH